MVKVLSKREAVEEYGTKPQKDHFNKYRRFTSKRVEESLFKTLEQHYSNVERVKEGRSICYRLSGKKSEVSDRQDDRMLNGSNMRVPYSYDLDMAIIGYLEGTESPSAFRPRTVASWMVEMGIATRSMHDAYLSRFDESHKKMQIDDLIDENVIEAGQNKVFSDYIDFHDTVRRNMESSFNRLLKSKIIGSLDEYWALVIKHEKVQYIDENGELFVEYEPTGSIHQAITAEEMGKVLSTRRKLIVDNDLTYSDIKYNNKHKAEKIDKCKEDIEEAMKTVLDPDPDGCPRQVVYVYKKQSFYMKATPPTVIKYIKKKILPFCDPKQSAELLIENYSGKKRDGEYLEILESFQKNKKIAIENRSEKISDKFNNFLKIEDAKLEEVNEMGGEWSSAAEIYSSSLKQGAYFRDVISGKHSEVIGNVDKFYLSNPKPLHLRMKRKIEKKSALGKLYDFSV
ncbi:hypothetical protein EVJ32_04575 [Exiguobacterium sp. SH5S4]|uniref:hypothetical protein n=1 Tax=Exiguobacterium sp. SH5S4 TaxID=2510961 RepID=UPI001038BBA3|nr:hypothetical protein [Exiguobacterium sp. SH5S4]TCI26652.1 hypothetical protein EVJ32_04575 [Exiguobacterium sp. SH5S4]